MNKFIEELIENYKIVSSLYRSTENMLKECLLEKEREFFEGKTYEEYINSLQINTIVDHVEITIDAWRLRARYQCDGFEIVTTGTPRTDSKHELNYKTNFDNRQRDGVAKKYKLIEEKMNAVISQFIIENPVKEYWEKSGLNR